MWDVLWDWMFTTDLGNTYVGRLAGFGEGIVATVEVLALLVAELAYLPGEVLWF
jgi:hypothetical protein